MNSFPQYRFRSNLFDIDPKEDEHTNPFCYGRELAEWIKQRFTGMGYMPEDVIPEDWGWCVMLQRNPYLLWIGCGNERSHFYHEVPPEQKHQYVPDGATTIWTCVVGFDTPVWTGAYWKRLLRQIDPVDGVRRVDRDLVRILSAEAAMEMMTEP